MDRWIEIKREMEWEWPRPMEAACKRLAELETLCQHLRSCAGSLMLRGVIDELEKAGFYYPPKEYNEKTEEGG